MSDKPKLGDLASLAGPIGSVLGSGINALSQSSMNKKTRKWNEHMMQLQRQWAHQDWEKQNAYNSPQQQMQRLKEAGLNPHLIYGGSSGIQAAQSINQPTPQNWNPKAPDLGAMLTGPVNAYMETRSFSSQQKLMDAQTLKVLSEINLNELTAENKEMLNTFQESILRENLTGKMISNKFQLDENTRRELTTASNLNEAATRIAKNLSDIDYQAMMKEKGNEEIKSIQQMREKVEIEKNNLIKSGFLLDFEKKLNDNGLTKNDGIVARLLSEILTGAGLSPQVLGEKLRSILQGNTKPKQQQSILNWFQNAFPRNIFKKGFKIDSTDRKNMGY